jgi:hypothetical protein
MEESLDPVGQNDSEGSLVMAAVIGVSNRGRYDGEF